MVPVYVLVGVPVPSRKAVVVPTPDLDKPHPSFKETPRRQTLLRKVITLLLCIDLLWPALRASLQSVQPQHMRGLVLEVECLRRRQLHPCRQLVAPDARLQSLVPRPDRRVHPVERREQIASLRLPVGTDKCARFVRKQVGDRSLRSGIDHRPAVLRGQKCTVPVFHPVGTKPTMVGQHHERRKVVVHGAKAVAYPTACARKSGQLKSGRLQQRGRGVDPGLADHVVDKRHLVNHPAQGGHRLAKHLPRLPVGLEVPDRP